MADDAEGTSTGVLPARVAADATGPGGQHGHEDEAALVAALRNGDEAAFLAVVHRHHESMVRLARVYVRERDVAEEVAQDTWLAVVQQLDRFEARSSLKTWIFSILVNLAKTRGVRERRTMPFSAFGADVGEEPAVAPDRFNGEDHRWAGHWAHAPLPWPETPEGQLLSHELGAEIRQAIDDLPSTQRAVVTLRDVQCFSAPEVCHLLGISEANQRVLLHRGRSKVRAALEQYVERLAVLR